MKKRFVLLCILISTQLYGCSKHALEVSETVPPAAKASSSESVTVSAAENDTKETKTSDKESQEETPGISTEQTEDSVSVHNTENAESSVRDISLQPEETGISADDNYYSAATGIPRAEVESYAAQIKQQFLERDWPAISSEISYPITISNSTYYNGTEFLDASNSFEAGLGETFFAALEEEDCREMFCNWQGIMLGETGQIWISEVLDENLNSQGLKIIAVNGS